MPDPRLIAVNQPTDPVAAVLVLHGGASRGESVAVSPSQLSVIRMIPIANRVARAGGGGLAVFRLLNSTRGWNATKTPVDDAHWALDEIASRTGGLPVGLIGHSLGGRAALLTTGDPAVRSVVALAPWVYPTDSADVTGRRVLIVHGDGDRIAQPSRSAAAARNLARTGEVGYITIEGGKHAMLRHHGRFDGYAAAFTAACLLPEPPGQLPEPVREVLAGAQWVTA